MLYISTSKIHESTIGASFTVSFTVAPDEIDYLTALHEKYAEMNMCGFTIKPSDSENPNNSQTCANCKFDHEEWFEEACDSCCDAHSNWQPKTEPQSDDKHAVCTGCDYYDLPNAFHPCASCVDFSKYKPKIEGEPQTETHDIRTDTHECVKTEPQTMDTFAIDMAVAKCKAQHNNCKNCDKKCVWRNEPQTEKADRIPFDPLVEMDIKRMVEARLAQTEREDK